MGGRHQAARPSLVLAVAEQAAALAAEGSLAAGTTAAAGMTAGQGAAGMAAGSDPGSLKADQESGIRPAVPDSQVFCQGAGECLPLSR